MQLCPSRPEGPYAVFETLKAVQENSKKRDLSFVRKPFLATFPPPFFPALARKTVLTQPGPQAVQPLKACPIHPSICQRGI